MHVFEPRNVAGFHAGISLKMLIFFRCVLKKTWSALLILNPDYCCVEREYVIQSELHGFPGGSGAYSQGGGAAGVLREQTSSRFKLNLV